MRIRRRIIFIFVMFLLVLGVLALSFRRETPEPVYQGKSLSYWLDDIGGATNNSPGSRRGRSEAEAAIRAIGTNALPQLIEMAGANDSSMKRRLILLARKQSLIKSNPLTSAERAHRAIAGFQALGPAAEPAIPALINLFKSPDRIYSDDNPAYTSARILGAYIGPPAIIPLINALTNANPYVRYHACFTLGWFSALHTNASVPALILRLQDPDHYVRCRAAIALANIHREPELVVPALVKALGDKESSVRFQAVSGLGSFGPQAAAAIPALSKALRNEAEMPDRPHGNGDIADKSREDVCALIRAVISSIDPEAAARILSEEEKANASRK